MHRAFTIIEDEPGRAEIAALLKRHLADMARHSPPESMHALDVEALSDEEITFWSVWAGEELVGCGALKQLDPTHGEIKSMHTASAHLRRGVASSLLTHVIAEAQRRGYLRLSLETGSMEAYEPARRLYRRFGFEVCDPFGDYVPDPNSTFMSRQI